MAKYKIIHDKQNCISCGACAAIAPELWEMDAKGLAQLKSDAKEINGVWELKN